MERRQISQTSKANHHATKSKQLGEKALPDNYYSNSFSRRHIGPNPKEISEMLSQLDMDSVEELIKKTVPESILLKQKLTLPQALSEEEALKKIHAMAKKNQVWKNYIGMGYYDCHTPGVIARNILENPGWYTQYTPYQAEIAQGRLEALLNFQTMVADLTGLPLSNASLLDEATAAAEAVAMCRAKSKNKKNTFLVDENTHPQTIEVIKTRAKPLGINIELVDALNASYSNDDIFGVLWSYPDTNGSIFDYQKLSAKIKNQKIAIVVATDLLALTLLRPPGEWGADIAIGSTQRFGVPLGFGGPHAAFLATNESFRRQIPGRIIGVSKDRDGKPAYRLALQTREQHIRRDKATSNICTSQVLLAVMSSMYAVYHGPGGLREIARGVKRRTEALKKGLQSMGLSVNASPVFDTVRVYLPKEDIKIVLKEASYKQFNIRQFEDSLGMSLDETTRDEDVASLLACFRQTEAANPNPVDIWSHLPDSFESQFARTSPFLEHQVFNSFHSEHEMLRYIKRLESKDLSLTTSMIALGSCTMKLNATSEMVPVTWKEFSKLHPFAPSNQSLGYQEMFGQLEKWLGEITGFDAVSLQPNAGAQGEYTGLLAIRAFHESRGDASRHICLIPNSAHGTNPASAIMAGYKVVAVKCDELGNIDVADLKNKANEYRAQLACIMVTYPSTHGVFEKEIKTICEVVHENGGQVYLDGANMNAQVGVCRPGDYGADVCHLNLHKTFCIPHGGGGPGMGPIGVKSHLAPFLPGHLVLSSEDGKSQAIGAVSAAPYGSSSILPISWMYIAMMGGDGLRQATETAILNANYMASRLRKHFDVLYQGASGTVAHEFILDMRTYKKSCGVEIDDIAKRLMDYGFHAPTMSFPVPGTLMIEPTESETKAELDRFCETLILIRKEIQAIDDGKIAKEDSPLAHAPHTALSMAAESWELPYSRMQAAFPASWLTEHKYWPPVSRIDNAYGDRNLICTCISVEDAELS